VLLPKRKRKTRTLTTLRPMLSDQRAAMLVDAGEEVGVAGSLCDAFHRCKRQRESATVVCDWDWRSWVLDWAFVIVAPPRRNRHAAQRHLSLRVTLAGL
jgi:hypothetical protein